MNQNELKKLAELYMTAQFPISREELKSLYRESAKKLHPDHGGNAEQFRVMIDVYKEISDQFPNPFFFNDERTVLQSDDMLVCWECNGIGYLIDTWKGFVSKRWGCSTCGGEGEITYEKWRSFNWGFEESIRRERERRARKGY